MQSKDLETKAAMCYSSFKEYWVAATAFQEDYIYFRLFMKRERKSNIEFTPCVLSKSFQSIIDNYNHNEEGLLKAFNIYTVMRQIILDFQEWNTPVYSVVERNSLLNYLVKHEWVDLDIFCHDFISCSHSYPEIRQKIDDILNA